MNRISEKQILYVDDEPQALKYFEQLFGDQFHIAVAGSADEAWEYVTNHTDKVAIVVTDHRMPERTGVELMEQLKAKHPNIIRILTTAYSNLESAVRSVNEGGAFRYLTKPWDDGEMVGTLLRALEFHDVIEQRDQLMSEKLGVLHRLVVMDRVRGLATAVTALSGTLRNAWPALVSYMQQSNANEQIRLQMDEIAELNMTVIARQQAEQMVRIVETIRADTSAISTGDEPDVDLGAALGHLVEAKRGELESDDLQIVLNAPESLVKQSDRGLFGRLIEIMIRRMADIQDQPAKLSVFLEVVSDEVQIRIEGSFSDLSPEQFASFFAAAIPLKKWPIGMDMDLLSAFMIVHHLGGKFGIQTSPPSLTATLPSVTPTAVDSIADPDWFSTVYESLQEWENAVIEY